MVGSINFDQSFFRCLTVVEQSFRSEDERQHSKPRDCLIARNLISFGLQFSFLLKGYSKSSTEAMLVVGIINPIGKESIQTDSIADGSD